MKTRDKVGEIGKGITSLAWEFEVYPDGKGTEDSVSRTVNDMTRFMF